MLRKTPLATALLRGSSRRAIPGPSLLARHPCLATPYATPTLGLLKGARDRVVWTFLNSNKAPSSFNGEQSRRMDATIKLLRWASPILRSKAHCTMLRLLISGTDQQTPPNAPFRRPNGIAALRGDPRSSDGVREVERSETRMQGQAFLVTFEGPAIRAFGKSDSPSRAKPMPHPTRPTGMATWTRAQKASRPRPLPQQRAMQARVASITPST